jgi:hypothetical protein
MSCGVLKTTNDAWSLELHNLLSCGVLKTTNDAWSLELHNLFHQEFHYNLLDGSVRVSIIANILDNIIKSLFQDR